MVAHIGGIPVEETIVAAASLSAVLVATTHVALARAAGWRDRRRGDRG